MAGNSHTSQLAHLIGSGSINFFGLPFAGKDSQAKLLADAVNGAVISGGDILRASASDEVKKIIADGHLAPTDEYRQLILPYFSRDEFKGKPLILSSVGRWSGEEEPVISALNSAEHSLKAVIYLHLDEKHIFNRFSHPDVKQTRGLRDDDIEHKLHVRIAEFHEKTQPVLDHYKKLGYLIEVDANQQLDAVEEQIHKALIEKLS
ncbi:AAA family ATPase [Candidatus Saccharibacteria bacterium]|nr:AAA family ATPase [Candidatus Saccharibacteria bacterium]